MRHVALPNEKTSRSYATAVRDSKVTVFKLKVKFRCEHTPDSIKQMLKINISHSEITVGVKIFKSSNGGVII